jgi:hypothetical protein
MAKGKLTFQSNLNIYVCPICDWSFSKRTNNKCKLLNKMVKLHNDKNHPEYDFYNIDNEIECEMVDLKYGNTKARQEFEKLQK